MGINTTAGRIALVEVNSPFGRLEFQFMPEGVTWKRNAKLQMIAVTGRNNDLIHYTGGNDILNFKIDFYSDEEGGEDVLRQTKYLKSLAMKDGGFGPARNVKLIMGKFAPNDVWAVKSVDVKYAQFDNYNDYLPMRASCDVRLVLDPTKNRSQSDVRR